MADELPEGFTRYIPLDQRPRAAPPEGFRYADEPPVPAVNAGISQPDYREPDAPTPALNAGISIDPSTLSPHELWMMQTQRATTPPQGQQVEGRLTRKTGDIGPAIGEFAHDYLTNIGELAKKGFTDPNSLTPGELLELGMVGTPMASTRVGGVYKKGFTPTQHEQLRAAGVEAVPRVAESGSVGQATGRAISAAPVGGGSLRKASEKATEQLTASGELAASRPTGAAVSQDVAGNQVRLGAMREAEFLRAAEEKLPPKLKALLGQSSEDMVGTIVKMAAETRPGANLSMLSQMRHAVGSEGWKDVQSAAITRLGKSPATGQFDSTVWLRNYGNLAPASKNVLFGEAKGKAGLRYHLDALEEASRLAPKWQQFEGGKRAVLGTQLGSGSLLALGWATLSGVVSPLAILTTILPTAAVGKLLSKPSNAAAAAQWAGATTRAIRANGNPAAMAGLSIATRNLENTLGVKIPIEEIVNGPPQDQGEE